MIELKKCHKHPPYVEIYFTPFGGDDGPLPPYHRRADIEIYCHEQKHSGDCKRKIKFKDTIIDEPHLSSVIDDLFKKWNDSFIYCSNHLEIIKKRKRQVFVNPNGLHFDCPICFNEVIFDIPSWKELTLPPTKRRK